MGQPDSSRATSGPASGRRARGVGSTVGAVLALAPVAEQAGRIELLGTPAEEHGGGKFAMLTEGAWEDVDFSLMVHGMTGGDRPAAEMRLTFAGLSMGKDLPVCGASAGRSSRSGSWLASSFILGTVIAEFVLGCGDDPARPPVRDRRLGAGHVLRRDRAGQLAHRRPDARGHRLRGPNRHRGHPDALTLAVYHGGREQLRRTYLSVRGGFV